MNNRITINDLKDDELRIILKALSIRELINNLRVCKKWQIIIYEILETQSVLTLLHNDINHFAQNELEPMCSTLRHIPINSSIGRIIGEKAIISALSRFHFSLIRDKLFNLLELCPNLQSLHLTEYYVSRSDINLILSNCPQLQCLSISSNERCWTESLLTLFSGLKHLSLLLKPKASLPFFDCTERSEIPLIDPKIEELIIEGDIDGFSNENIFYSELNEKLKSINSKIKKFHFLNSDPMFGEKVLDIINALSEEELNKSNIKNLNINAFVFDEMLEAINNRFSSLEILYLNFKSYSNRRVSLKKLKNLRQINLNFNTTNHKFGLRAVSKNDNSLHLSALLNHSIPSTVKKLSLSNAFISLSVFKDIKNYLPLLEVLELNYVCIEMDCGLNFWEVIANFKYLQFLTLNLTDINDDGSQHISNSESLQTLELVKYNGPKAGKSLISSHKIIESFENLANRNRDKWFTLRLDIDVFEVNDDIKRKIPRNMKLLNVGFKK